MTKVAHLEDREVLGDEQEEVKGKPRDGEADADPGQDDHHLAVPLHLAFLPARVAREAGIFSKNINFNFY